MSSAITLEGGHVLGGHPIGSPQRRVPYADEVLIRKVHDRVSKFAEYWGCTHTSR